jgi:hypothetical protein
VIATTHIPCDPALPSLAVALDPARMRVILSEHLAASSAGHGVDVRVERCRIERVRYKPGRSCLVCYALEIRIDDASDVRSHTLCARMYPPGQSVSRYARAARLPLEDTSPFAPLLHLPALDMIVWSFPNERKLTSLPRLVDGSWLRACVFPVLVARLHGHDWRLIDGEHELVHYVPEHTCSVRAVVDARRGDGDPRRCVVYGKVYYDDAGRHVCDAMRQLWQSRAVLSGKLAIARPLLYEAGDRVLWQEGLEGDTLERRHPDDRIPTSALRRVAGAIAALHVSPVAQIPGRRPDDTLTELRERAGVLAHARPHLRGRLDRIVSLLAATPPAAVPLATLHGDLHPKNVFLMDGGVGLIDLDNIHRGAAEQDLASWIACMLYRALLRRERLDTALDAARAFLRHYEQERAAPIDSDALDWYAGAALVSERAYRSLSRLKDGRLELLDDLLALSLEVIGGRLLSAAPEGLRA